MKSLLEYTEEKLRPINEDDLLGGGDDGGDEGGGDAGKAPKLKKEISKDEQVKERGEIKFTIWKSPDKKVQWLEDGEKFQKIEYQLDDKKSHIQIDFLLGFSDNSWKLWIGKIGAVTYDDDPYKDLKTTKFAEAMVKCLDEVQDFIADVRADAPNYVQYYTNV